MSRFIDLSLVMEPSVGEPVPVEIEYTGHAEGADILGRPIGIGREQFPDGKGLSLEIVRLTSHSGTHMDAPAHYGPECEGRPARSIEQVPLDWCFSSGVRFDCRGDCSDGPVTREELQDKAAALDRPIAPKDIVLIWTGADALWGRPEYFTDFRGMSAEATEWLIDRGVKVIGIDSFGFDAPFDAMLENYRRSASPDDLWPAHVLGRRREYCQIERLCNLAALPCDTGFQIACFPIKTVECGAGWTRTVAILEEE